MIAGPPSRRIVVPPAVVRLAANRPVTVVWRNELGGLTFEVGGGTDRCFVKWAPAGSGLDLASEAERLAWAAQWIAVPRPLDRGDDEDGSWLITAGLVGESAVAGRWKAQPARAVAAFGRGLRAFHDALPAGDCPFSWSAEERVADARRRAASGEIAPDRWNEDWPALPFADALEQVADPPPVDRLVVCHGDACAPNTLIGDDGACVGQIDLGHLGVADRWADLAVATWSTRWNYGSGWESVLLDAYGIGPDPERTRYYRLLVGVARICGLNACSADVEEFAVDASELAAKQVVLEG